MKDPFPIGFISIVEDTIYFLQNYEPELFKFSTDGRCLFRKKLDVKGFVKPPPMDIHYKCTEKEKIAEAIKQWADSWTPIITFIVAPHKYIVVVFKKKGEHEEFINIYDTCGNCITGDIEVPPASILRYVDRNGKFYFVSTGKGESANLFIASLKDL